MSFLLSLVRALMIMALLFPAWEALGIHIDSTGWLAQDLENLCSSHYFPVPRKGYLGDRVHGKLEPNRLYQKFDSLLGGMVFVMTDFRGNLDARPLGTNTVFECGYGAVIPKKDESNMCELFGGELKPLKKSDPKAKTKVVYRLVFNSEWSGNVTQNFKWQYTQEVKMDKRSRKGFLSLGGPGDRRIPHKIIVPGESVPKLYRKDTEYWKKISGKVFPVSKSHWMQMFKDGSYHQVRIEHHLEEWPGEPDIVVQVRDDEEWIKIGKGDNAYVFIDKSGKSDIDWKRYYQYGVERPSNPRVSALGACSGCAGDKEAYVHDEDGEEFEPDFEFVDEKGKQLEKAYISEIRERGSRKTAGKSNDDSVPGDDEDELDVIELQDIPE